MQVIDVRDRFTNTRRVATPAAKSENDLEAYMRRQADALDAVVQSFGLPLAMTGGQFVGNMHRPTHFVYNLTPANVDVTPRIGEIDAAAFTDAIYHAVKSDDWQFEEGRLVVKVPIPWELQNVLIQMTRK